MNTPGAFAKQRRGLGCECCRNPWNSREEENTKEGGTVVCNPCLNDSKGYTGIDPASFDDTQDLHENFYEWAVGGWRNNNPIPAEYSSWNTFVALRDLNIERLKDLVDELSANRNDVLTGNALRLSNYFISAMDESVIEARGIAPLIGAFEIAQKSISDPTSTIAQLHKEYGVNAFFTISSEPDMENSKWTLCNISQSGLGLPDRDYYFDNDKESKREKYISFIADTFKELGNAGMETYKNEQKCQVYAKLVFDFEKSLASAHWTRTERRNPDLQYNKMSVQDLQAKSTPQTTWPSYLAYGKAKAGFDWNRYFTLTGKSAEALGDVNVSNVTYMRTISGALSSPALTHYLVHQIALSYAEHLPDFFVQKHFEFFLKELSGQSEIKPRWKRCLAFLETALGEALGELYVAKYFNQEAKERALTIIEKVREALKERLLEVEWMSEPTRAEAMKKMASFRPFIGYPDKWIDYSSFDTVLGQHLENEIAARSFHLRLEQSRMNAATDLNQWHMTPQTINAYYHPLYNIICFPAAILQAPFFDKNADDAVNFGSMGAVVGHEMTHGFDDEGRKFDSEGNKRDWWVKEDGEEYTRRVQVMIDQAEKFSVLGQNLKGKLVCGENIADTGGLRIAYRAMQKHLAALDSPPPLINGFTPDQRFFLAWAQAWRQNIKEERAKMLVTLDPHGPNDFRCNNPLSNIQEFLDAFGITEGDQMFRPVSERVDIW